MARTALAFAWALAWAPYSGARAQERLDDLPAAPGAGPAAPAGTAKGADDTNAATPMGTAAPPPVKISGLLFDGFVPGDPDPEEAIRIANDSDKDIEISDWYLSDRFGVYGGGRSHEAAFPTGTTLGARAEAWIAYDGPAFNALFGHKPDFEAENKLTGVPEMVMPGGRWLKLPSTRGVLSLHDAHGAVVDAVPYEASLYDRTDLSMARVPGSSWRGPPVMLKDASPFAWTGQVLARDRLADGRLAADTDTASDWDSGFSVARLGVDEVHRVELAGQTRFAPRPFHGVEGNYTAASSPENAFLALAGILKGAKKRIQLHVYQFENDHLADALVDARKRGVEVTVYLEGSPVGGIPDQERHIAERVHDAGGKVYFLISDAKRKIHARYRFDHSKYCIVDDKVALISSENFGYTGMPVDPSYGNRGWTVVIEQPELVRQLREVFESDLAVGAFRDLIEYADDPGDKYGAPESGRGAAGGHGSGAVHEVKKGRYMVRRSPLRVQGKADLELVLCPDNCLAEKSGLLGLIRNAKQELLVVQNSIPLWWGKLRKGSREQSPNLPLQACIDAARRGVRVRVLLDGTWYNTEAEDPRDNDDTVRALSELAAREKLDLQAKVLNLYASDLEKVHAKGVIADRERVFVGSINWTENSFKGNREVGVVVGNKSIADYFVGLFTRDWGVSRLYRVQVAAGGTEVRERQGAGGAVMRKYRAGDVLDIVSEGAEDLEVRLSETATGWMPRKAVGQLIVAAEEAHQVIGREALVEGRVRSTHEGGGDGDGAGLALNFGDDWKTDFSVLIPTRLRADFDKAGLSPGKAEGRELRVRGTVGEKNGPLIVVTRPEDVEFPR